jgi:hypothetical protein
MKWITRSHAMVDRIACPWLIRKFVDSKAEFIFIAADKASEAAKELDAIPFDVPGVELSHKGDECSFDAIIKKYNLKDQALLELAKIVRGADTKSRDLTPQSEGLIAIAEGFRLMTSDDYDNMEKQFPVYDALYAFCCLKVASSK